MLDPSVRAVLTAVLCSAACVLYFFVLDRAVFSSAHFSLIFRTLLSAYDSRTAWPALAVCIAAALWKWPASASKVVDFFANHPYLIAFAGTAALAAGSVLVYRSYPLSMDEYAAVFQARIFASGHLAARLPPALIDWLVVRGFNGEFLIASSETGQAIGKYWPGFALLLAPFEWVSAPWLCNALLAGLAIALVHRITREITGDRQAAGWAVLFTVASGAFVADAISYYSMQAHLTANLAFVALLLRPTAYRAFGAGLVGSLALILHNPVPHGLFALPWMLALVVDRNWRCLLPLLLGYLPGVCIGLAWLGYRSGVDPTGHGGAGWAGFAGGVFAWPNGNIFNARAASLVKMWLWAVPGLFLLAALGATRWREERNVRLLAWSAAATFVGYLFVQFDQGHGWGNRYFQSAWGVIPVLAGCAMGQDRDSDRLKSFAGAASILSLAIILPFQMNQIHGFIAEHLAQLPRPERPGNHVYFIKPRGGFYVADMVQMDPQLRGEDLFLVSHGPEEDRQLIRRNWPAAVLTQSSTAADLWYLGPTERRTSRSGERIRWHFGIADD